MYPPEIYWDFQTYVDYEKIQICREAFITEKFNLILDGTLSSLLIKEKKNDISVNNSQILFNNIINVCISTFDDQVQNIMGSMFLARSFMLDLPVIRYFEDGDVIYPHARKWDRNTQKYKIIERK